METLASIPLIVAVFALILWFIATREPWDWVAEVARLSFFASLLAWLFSMAGKSLL